MKVENHLGPVVQSIVSLTSSIEVKMLTVLVSSNLQVRIFAEQMWVAFANAHFFSKYISVYAIFNGQTFNDTLTNNIVSFEQLGSGVQIALTPAVTSYKICVSVFTDATEAAYMTFNLPFCFLLWQFKRNYFQAGT